MRSSHHLPLLATLLLATACSSSGPAGSTGPAGPAGPAGTVVFGTSAGTAAEGNDPRLSDARAPLPGSAAYIQNGTASQVASLSITGSGTFGSVTASGSVAAAQFSGSGAGLTSLPGAAVTGTLPDAALSANVPRLNGNNTFSGVNTFPAPVNAGDAATKGYVDVSTAPLGRMANYFTEQTSALQVITAVWTAVPGTQVTFASPASTASLTASGGIAGMSPSISPGTCGFRFVLDGAGLGDATWGDRLVQCPQGTYCSWSMQRVVSLPAGSHTVSVQQTGWGASIGCQSGGASYADTKLMVSTY